MVQNLGRNSLAVRREIVRIKLLHSIYYNKKFLPDSLTPKHARCANTKFKLIVGRVQAYSNSFVPLATQQWNIVPANIVNIDCLVKFIEKLNDLIKQSSYLSYLVVSYICTSIFICMCICVYVCIYMHEYIYICMYMDVCIMCMYACIHLCVCLHAYVYVCAYGHVH